MLGYSVTVHEVANVMTEADLTRAHTLPYPESIDSVMRFMAQPGIHVASCTRVDAILDCAERGSARLVHDGGYPYLIYARGSDIVRAFSRELEGSAGINEDRWYMVEAWDQS